MIRTLLTVLAVFVALATTAVAHRQPEVVTTIEPVVSTHGSEGYGITHRLHAHDAIELLRALGERSPNLDDPDQLAALAVYAADKVVFAGNAVSKPVGAEIEGNHVFVFVRHPEAAPVVSSTMLSDVMPGWVNTLNVKDEDGLTRHTASFNADRQRATAEDLAQWPSGVSAPDAGQAPDHAAPR